MWNALGDIAEGVGGGPGSDAVSSFCGKVDGLVVTWWLVALGAPQQVAIEQNWAYSHKRTGLEWDWKGQGHGGGDTG